MENVVTVIVTYNRLKLLQEAIFSVRSQSQQPSVILVINNGATDGTTEWLSTQEGLTVLHLKKNLGASMGFYTGIKAAVSLNKEWIWVMDDDTICESNTLTNLLNKTQEIENIGFIGSKCNWRDGKPHLMNVPCIRPQFNKTIPFNKYDQFGLILTESSSWVSLLLSSKAVKEVGLPYKEFFFWSDDLEYTQRITRAGYLGFYCKDSVVLHNSAANYFPDFYNETPNNTWKHRFGFRNEFFLKKKDRGLLYFIFWLLAKVSYTSYKLFKIRKKNRIQYIGVLLNAAWNSIFFNPKIDKL